MFCLLCISSEIYENAFSIFSLSGILVNIIRNNSYMALNYCNQNRSNSYDETFRWRHIQQAVDMFQSAEKSWKETFPWILMFHTEMQKFGWSMRLFLPRFTNITFTLVYLKLLLEKTFDLINLHILIYKKAINYHLMLIFTQFFVDYQ